MGRVERAEQAAVGLRAIGLEADVGDDAAIGAGDRGVIGHARDLARGADRGAAIDARAAAGVVGDAGADDEVERGGAPHAIGELDLGQALERESGGLLEMLGAQFALARQFDRELGLAGRA